MSKIGIIKVSEVTISPQNAYFCFFSDIELPVLFAYTRLPSITLDFLCFISIHNWCGSFRIKQIYNISS